MARQRLPRWLRIVLRSLGWTLVAAVVVPVLLAFAILYTDVGTRVAGTRGLALYDGMIPGSARAEIAGSIGGTLVLRNVRLADREGGLLASSARVELSPDLGALFGGVIRVRRAALDQVVVTADGAWGDLGPEPDPDEVPEPEPPKEGLGPQMPFLDVVELAISGGIVQLRDAEPSQPLLEIDRVRTVARGDGHLARATLETALRMPAQDLDVRALSVVIQWDDPIARVVTLDVDGNFGSIDLKGAVVDAATWAWGLDGIEIQPDATWLRDRAPGIPQGMELGLTGAAPDGSLALTVQAAVPDAAVSVAIAGRVPRFETADLDIDVACRPCGRGGSDISASLRGDLEFATGAGTAALAAAAAGTRVEGRATLTAQRELDAMVNWRSPDLSVLRPALAAFGIDAPLRGSTAGEASCTGPVQPPALACRATADVAGYPPIVQAGITADVQLDNGVHATIERLFSRIRGYEIRLTEGPARIDYTAPELRVRRLTLVEGQGRGAVAISGTLDPAGSSDLTAQIRTFRLAALEGLAPGLGLRGEVAGRVRAAGPRDALAVRADLRARGLALKDVALGGLELDGTIDGNHTDGSVRLDGPWGTLRAQAKAPIALDLAGQQPGVRVGTGTVTGRLTLNGVDLAALDPKLVGVAGARGNVELHGDVTGTLARPRIAAQLDARGLALGEHAVGDLQVDVGYRHRRAELQVELRGPPADLVRVWARVPLTLDLRAGRARWSRQGEHEVRIAAVGIDLARIPVPMEPTLSGSVDATIDLTGRPAQPQMRVQVAGTGLALEGRELGMAHVDLATQGLDTQVDVRASGPAFHRLTLSARAPVGLDLPTGRPHWDPDGAVDVDLRLRGTDLVKIAAAVPGLPVAGIADARFTARGPLRAPELDLDLDLDQPGFRDIRLDLFRARAWYAEELTHVELLARNGEGDVLVRGMAPVSLDIPQAAFEWRDTEPHEIVVDLEGIDRTALEGLVPLPDDVDARLAGHLEARGSTRTVRASGRLTTRLRAAGIPPYTLRTELEATETAQRVVVTVRDRRRTEATMKARSELDLVGYKDGRTELDTTPIEAELSIPRIDLERFAALLPAAIYRPSGTVRSRLSIDGTIGRPSLRGHLVLEDVAATLIALRQRISGLGMRVDFGDDHITLRSLSLRSGGGSLEASGDVTLADEQIRARLDLHADQIPIRQPPLPSMRLTTDVATRIELGRTRGTLDVGIDDSTLEVLSLSSSGAAKIPDNPNVRFVDGPGRRARAAAEARAREAATSDTRAAPPRTIAASLHLDDPFVVRGPAVDMAWTGRLDGTLSPEIRFDGGFRTQVGESTFDLFGNTFEIEQGTVTLAEESGLEPFVDVVAHTQVDTVRITASIQGRITNAELHLSSEPPEREQDILAMLVTGSADLSNADSGQVAAQAASTLAALSSPALQQGIGDTLGVDTMRVSFGESLSEPIVSMGKNLRKNVYAEASFHGNAPADENRTEFMIRYRFLPSWALEVFYGDRNVGGAGVWWIRLFDRAIRNDSKADP